MINLSMVKIYELYDVSESIAQGERVKNGRNPEITDVIFTQ